MPTLRDNRPSAFSSHRVLYGPDDARVEDDRIVAAVLGQQDVSQQRGDVSAGDVVALLVEEHRAIRICVPRNAKRRAFFPDELLSLRAIAGQHRIARIFGYFSTG